MIDHGDEAAHEAAQGHVHIERHSGSKVGILNASGLNNVQAGRGAAASLAVGLTGFLTSTHAPGGVWAEPASIMCAPIMSASVAPNKWLLATQNTVN